MRLRSEIISEREVYFYPRVLSAVLILGQFEESREASFHSLANPSGLHFCTHARTHAGTHTNRHARTHTHTHGHGHALKAHASKTDACIRIQKATYMEADRRTQNDAKRNACTHIPLRGMKLLWSRCKMGKHPPFVQWGMLRFMF